MPCPWVLPGSFRSLYPLAWPRGFSRSQALSLSFLSPASSLLYTDSPLLWLIFLFFFFFTFDFYISWFSKDSHHFMKNNLVPLSAVHPALRTDPAIYEHFLISVSLEEKDWVLPVSDIRCLASVTWIQQKWQQESKQRFHHPGTSEFVVSKSKSSSITSPLKTSLWYSFIIG